MSSTTPQALLRPGLLDGSALMLAVGASSGPSKIGAAAQERCEQLGASLVRWELTVGEPAEQHETAAREAFTALLAGLGGLDTLIVDCGSMFVQGGGQEALLDCLQSCWNATRLAVEGAFLPAGRGGRVLLLAPAAGAGEHTVAAVAGVENLARTLSIEWARHGITTVALAPGSAQDTEEPASIVAYMASIAGAYFSGCLLDLRGVSV
jgi:NAD(P)-dependent dehydrogenase (short-subunit alcohol dehydrogenase family)